jgi:hypothetical protein
MQLVSTTGGANEEARHIEIEVGTNGRFANLSEAGRHCKQNVWQRNIFLGVLETANDGVSDSTRRVSLGWHKRRVSARRLDVNWGRPEGSKGQLVFTGLLNCHSGVCELVIEP